MIIKIVKIYIGFSLMLLWVLWVQFIFSQFLVLAYISQDLQAPSYVVGTNHGVLIYCLSLPRRFPLLQLLLFAGLFSVPLTQRGWWWTLFLLFFLGSLVQSHCGEGGTLQTNNTGMCSQCLSHIGPASSHSACSLPAHTAQALGCSSGNHRWLALGCLHLPGPSRSGSGTRVVLRGSDSVGPAFCALPRSKQLR